jgi:site-specific recombinase XerD
MATFKYYLRTNTVWINYSYSRTARIRHSTGISLNKPRNWNPKDQNIRPGIDEPGAKAHNYKLSTIKADFLNLVATLEITNTYIDNLVLSEAAKEALGKTQSKQNKETPDFLSYFKQYIDHYKTHPLDNTGRPLAPSTVKTYSNALNLIKQFSTDSKYVIQYDRINREFYDSFYNWCVGKEYSDNYFGAAIKTIKTIYAAALELGYHEGLEHKKKYFKKLSVEADEIYLNMDELEAIYKLDLSNERTLDRARDLFLIGAYTGLRVSDFSVLNKTHFKEKNGFTFLEMENKKTRTMVAIPLNSHVKSIINKYGGNPPNNMSEQQINKAIKIVGEKAKLADMATVSKIIAGKKITETVPKYKLIKNHTARRSFCTNAYLHKDKMDIVEIMSLSGHKTLNSFLKYVRADHLQKAQNLARNSFFN